MWHLLPKSTLVASHLQNLQTFSSGRVDSIQTYLARVPLVQHKESSVIQKHVDGTTTSWLLAESGKKAEGLSVLHTMELFRAPLSCRNRKAPGFSSDISFVACSTNGATFWGARASCCRTRLVFSIRFQNNRGNVAMKKWKQVVLPRLISDFALQTCSPCQLHAKKWSQRTRVFFNRVFVF